MDELRYRQSLVSQESTGPNCNVTWFWRRNDVFVVPFTSDESAVIEELRNQKEAKMTGFLKLSKKIVPTRFGDLEFDLKNETGIVIVGHPAMYVCIDNQFKARFLSSPLFMIDKLIEKFHAYM